MNHINKGVTPLKHPQNLQTSFVHWLLSKVEIIAHRVRKSKPFTPHTRPQYVPIIRKAEKSTGLTRKRGNVQPARSRPHPAQVAQHLVGELQVEGLQAGQVAQQGEGHLCPFEPCGTLPKGGGGRASLCALLRIQRLPRLQRLQRFQRL
jgi:hypothetical protein